MSAYQLTKNVGESNADKLRYLLNGSGFDQQNQSAVEYLKSKFSFGSDGIPALDDIVRLVQTIENVNQQLLFENKYLKDETTKTKTDVLRLIEENVCLHKELKNCTVLEILAELQNNPENLITGGQVTENNKNMKSKDEELQRSQLLINELQKKLLQETSKNPMNRTGTGAFKSNTLDTTDISPICCTKCVEEIEIKVRQIENLKNDNEQLIKSKDFLKSKLEASEIKESDLITQIKKYADLVEHIELEKNQAVLEKDQYAQEKMNSDQKIEEFLREFQENLNKEKRQVVENVNEEIEQLNGTIKELETKAFKQESTIDKLTRDKIGLISELESCKKKCNSIDLDTHQMAEKLRNKYQEVLKERDVSLFESKRIRHDYDQFIKDTDQDMFCLRNELSTVRNRLLETEKDAITARDQCIQFTEEINKLKEELLSVRHAKNSIEDTRGESIKEITEKYESRESQLASGIEAIQARYCVTVKELEDLIQMQKKLLTKLKSECKTLNEQLEILAIKYKNDVTYLKDDTTESATRIEKYKARLDELEEQSSKHNDLHDKMKQRLKEMTLRTEKQNQELELSKSNETLMKTTNMQLLQEIESYKKQLNLFSMPSKMGEPIGGEKSKSKNLYGTGQFSSRNLNVPFMTMQPLASSRTNGPLESARSAIEESIFSIRSKIAL